jgi:hypothetical protein
MGFDGLNIDPSKVVDEAVGEIEKGANDLPADKQSDKACKLEIPTELTNSLADASDMMKKLNEVADFGCDVECKYEKKKNILLREMKNAENVYNNAPDNLKNAQKKYYNFTSMSSGNPSYDAYETSQVSQIVSLRKKAHKDHFQKIKQLLIALGDTNGSTEKDAINEQLEQLRQQYDQQTTEFVKVQNAQKGFGATQMKISERESYYKTKDIEVFKTLNIFITILLFILLFAYLYIFLFVYSLGDFSNTLKKRSKHIAPIVCIYLIVMGSYIYSSKSLFTPRISVFKLIFGDFFDQFLSDTSMLTIDFGPFRKVYDYICSFKN